MKTFKIQELARTAATQECGYGKDPATHRRAYEKFLTIFRRDRGGEEIVPREHAAIAWDMVVRTPRPAYLTENPRIPESKMGGDYSLGDLVALVLVTNDAADTSGIERQILKDMHSGALRLANRVLIGGDEFRHARITRDVAAAWLIAHGYVLPPELHDLPRVAPPALLAQDDGRPVMIAMVDPRPRPAPVPPIRPIPRSVEVLPQ